MHTVGYLLPWTAMISGVSLNDFSLVWICLIDSVLTCVYVQIYPYQARCKTKLKGKIAKQ